MMTIKLCHGHTVLISSWNTLCKISFNDRIVAPCSMIINVDAIIITEYKTKILQDRKQSFKVLK